MELQHVHRLAFCILDVETEVKVVINDKKKKKTKSTYYKNRGVLGAKICDQS